MIGSARREAGSRSPDAGGGQLRPGAFCVLGEPQQLEIRRRDHPGVEEHVEIDDPRPVAAIDANEGNRASLARLYEREHLEQLGERAKASGEGDYPRRAHRQMHLAHGEGVELEGQLGRRIGIRLLLAWRSILNPMDGAPTSDAPRLAASMMPGPPPVAMTLSRWPSIGAGAPLCSDTMRPKPRDSSYQRAIPAAGAPRASPFAP